MSWSISLIGTEEGVLKDLDAEAERLTGECKEEYMEALPHIKGLVGLNTTDRQDVLILLEAHGGHSRNYADRHNPIVTSKSCVVKIQRQYVKLSL